MTKTRIKLWKNRCPAFVTNYLKKYKKCRLFFFPRHSPSLWRRAGIYTGLFCSETSSRKKKKIKINLQILSRAARAPRGRLEVLKTRFPQSDYSVRTINHHNPANTGGAVPPFWKRFPAPTPEETSGDERIKSLTSIATAAAAAAFIRH